MRWLGVLHPLHIMMHVATSLCKLHHVTPLLKSLPWLKVPQHIHFKIAYLSNNALQTSQPSYICQLLTVRPTGSIVYSLLVIFFISASSLVLTLVYAVPDLRNGLPTDFPQFAHHSSSACTFICYIPLM